MQLINLESTDPFYYLALEEVLLKKSQSDYLILAVNDPSVIIGKHQSAHREVSTKFITENRIPVIRRISGGGTVFHDAGNLNFSFIRQSEEGKQVDFRKYTRPVIDFLISVGAAAKFEGKNDIKINGLKISGNAEHVHRNRVLHHGTLLFNTSLEMLRKSIRQDKSGYITRAVDSNPSSVINLKEILKDFSDIREFSKSMINHFYLNIPDLEQGILVQHYTEEAVSLAESKYRQWNWNFAYGPDYHFKNSFNFNNTLHTVLLHISNGIVTQSTIDGSDKMRSFAEKLKGCRHMVPDFTDLFEKENILIPTGEIFNFF